MTLGDFYNGKRVLLTGHTGFKGAWLALWLHGMGAEVGAFSLEPPSVPSLWELAGVENFVTRLGGDICDLGALTAACDRFHPEVVIHMAAQSLVRQSYKTPVETFSTNVMGTVHVLEAVRRVQGVRSVVIVTSDKCYENREQREGYREGDAMGGHDPYSASKGCAELVTASYTRSFFREGGTAVASVRAGNVIGGGDFAADRLVPDMVRSFRAGEVVQIRNPHAIRPWQFVLEPLSGYLLLGQSLAERGQSFSGGWNFGPEDDAARTVGEVVERFATLWGGDAAHVFDGGDHPHEATWLKLDCTKANTVLGWTPRTDFSQGLALTCEWYRAWAAGENPQETALDQIRHFEELA